MKTVLTICASLLLLAGAEAQKKPSLSKAKSLWEQGTLDEAKAMIDEATTYEKTMNDGKTWYYRGLIYATLDTTSNEAFSSLEPNARKIALESFVKADELGEKDKDYFIYGPLGFPITKTQQIAGYYSYYFDRAASEYGVDDYASASRSFEIASQISTDTTALNNAGYAAQANEEYDRAIEMFNQSQVAGAQSLSLYQNLINLYLQIEQKEKALETIAKAKAIYPADNGLNRSEISILIGQGKQEEALKRLNGAIEKEPTDIILRYVLGILYEELKDKDAALKAYEEAIAVDPSHFESNFNKAVILFDKANALYKEKGLLGYSAADQKKAKELDPKIKEAFLLSIPAWEKVYSLNPKERSALESMVFIYAYLGEEKKADKAEAELIALGDEDQ